MYTLTNEQFESMSADTQREVILAMERFPVCDTCGRTEDVVSMGIYPCFCFTCMVCWGAPESLWATAEPLFY